MYAPTLIDRYQLKSLSQVDGVKSTLHICIEWFSIFGSAFLSEKVGNLFFSFICVIFIAARYHALSVLGHDANHNLLYRRPLFNKIAAKFFLLWPLSAALEEFRQEHLRHHRHLGTQQDPDLTRLAQYPEFQFPMPFIQMAKILLLDFTGLHFLRYFFRSRQFRVLKTSKDVGSRRSKTLAIFVFYFLIFLVAYALGQLRVVFLYWLVPYMTWYQVIFRIRTIAEHSVVKEQSRFATNTVLTSPVSEIFLGLKNANYHAEHHLFASVPWFNLRRLHHELCKSSDYLSSSSIYNGYSELLLRCISWNYR